jgi:molybdopterin biosynthesis enzyme MoaB
MIRALAITVSNRAAAGVYADRSGPVLVELLRSAGCETDGPQVIPDGAPVEQALRDAVRAGYDVVVSTGLSRGLAGLAGQTLVVNLPGSTGGVRDGMAVLSRILGHAVDQARGGDHPRGA